MTFTRDDFEREPWLRVFGDPEHPDDAVTLSDLSRSDETKLGHLRNLRAFIAFASLDGLPARPRVVADYLWHLRTKQGKAVNTLKAALSSLSFWHTLADERAAARGDESVSNPVRSQTVKEALAKICKDIVSDGGVVEEPKQELQLDEIAIMIASEPSTLRGLRNKAIMAFTWATGMRRSEVAEVRDDDLRRMKGGIRVRVRKAKTQHDGEITYRTLPSLPPDEFPDAPFDPVALLDEWRAAAGIAPRTHVFRRMYKGDRVSKDPLSDESIAEIVKQAGARTRIAAPERLGAHSLRAGLATELSEGGISTERGMAKGGWRSLTAYRRYTRVGGKVERDPLRDVMSERSKRE